MASSFNISVGADTSKLERDIQQAAARLRKPIDIKIRDSASSALGNITGATTDFNKALNAATARVVAFGAAAGAFNLVRKGVEELLRSTVEVESSLARININLNETQDGLKQFSKNIFDIARNTGQTFETAAKAAEELTRQGLTATETTTRLRDALILSRLAAIDSNEAVNSLTASINSFSKEALNSTEILNKLAAVDAKFAVSTADLAAAISRVGSSASDAGVSFDQLLGIVTSVQQTTARGGAVIGNALKTIFTRIERSSTLDDLEALGIGVRDVQGKTLPAIQILTELAKTYDTLSSAQKSAVAEQVGGVFQINILKAALGDLGKEYSVYKRALETATQASDEAFRKNEILNQTLASSFNELRQSFTQLFAEFGKINLSPLLKTLTDGLTGIAKFLSSSDAGKDAGKTIGENILQGIGNVLTGPGVVALAAIFQSVIFTLARKVGSEFGDALSASLLRSGALGAGGQAGKIVQAKRIVPRAAGGLLPSVAGEMASINSGVGGATRSARPVVIPNFNFGGGKRGPVVANTDEYMVPNFAGTGGSAIFNKNMVSMYGMPRGARKLAEGYIPNFALGATNAALRLQELNAANPKFINQLFKKFGTKTPVAQGAQSVVFETPDGSTVIKVLRPTGNENYREKAKRGDSFNKLAREMGFGNFYSPKARVKKVGGIDVLAQEKVDGYTLDDALEMVEKNNRLSVGSTLMAQNKISKNISDTFNADKFDSYAKKLGIPYSEVPIIDAGRRNFMVKRSSFPLFQHAVMNATPTTDFAKMFKSLGVKVAAVDLAGGFVPNFAKISSAKISGELEKKRRLSTESGSELEYLFNPKKRAIEIDHIRSQKKGDAFQLFTALAQRSKRSGLPIYSGVLSRQYGAYDPKTKKYNEIAFNSEYSNYENLIRAYPQLRYRDQPGLKNFFNMSMVDTRNPDETFYKKFRGLRQAEKFVNNISKWDFARYFRDDQFSISGLKTFAKASGYVPNFANSLGAAIARERAAGVPSSQIYIDRDRRVINKNNPLGLLVANRNDEPLGGHQGVTRMLKQGRNPFFAGLDETYDATHFYNKAKGYVPNFAVIPPDRPDRFNRQEWIQLCVFIEQKQLDKLNTLFNTMGKVNGKALEEAMGEVLKIEKEVSSKSTSAAGLITGRRLGVQKRRALSGATYTGGGIPEQIEEPISGPRASVSSGSAFAPISPRVLEASRSASRILQRQKLANREAEITEKFEAGQILPNEDLRFLRERATKQVDKLKIFKGLSEKEIAGNAPLRELYESEVQRRVGGIQTTNVFRQKQAQQAKLQGRLTTLAIASSFAAPSIENAIGGVSGGIAGGALQGVGIGAMFSPQVAVAGGIIGGVIGAFSNLKSSTEKLNDEFLNFTAKGGEALQNTQQYIQATEELQGAVVGGADIATIRRLESRKGSIENALPDDIRKELLGAKTTQERMGVLNRRSRTFEAETTQKKQDILLSELGGGFFSKALGGIESLRGFGIQNNGKTFTSSNILDIYNLNRQNAAAQRGREAGRTLTKEQFQILSSETGILGKGKSAFRMQLASFANDSGANTEMNRQTLQRVFNKLGQDVEVTRGNFDDLAIALQEMITTSRRKAILDKESAKEQEEVIAFFSKARTILGYKENIGQQQNIMYGGLLERSSLLDQSLLSLSQPRMTSLGFSKLQEKTELAQLSRQSDAQKFALRTNLGNELRAALAGSDKSVLGDDVLLKASESTLLQKLGEQKSPEITKITEKFTNDLKLLNRQMDENSKTVSKRYELERKVDEIQRRRNSFLGGASLGDIGSFKSFGKAFEPKPIEVGNYGLRKIQQNDAFLGLGQDIKGLTEGKQFLTPEMLLATQEAEKEKQKNVIRNVLAQFLEGRDPSRSGIYRDTEGVPLSLETLMGSLKRVSGGFTKGSREAAIAAELAAQAKSVVGEGPYSYDKEAIGDKGYVKGKGYVSYTMAEKEAIRKQKEANVMNGEDEETKSLLEYQKQLAEIVDKQKQNIEALGKQEVTINTIIDGTIKIMAEALSEGQSKEVADKINAAVKSVLENAYNYTNKIVEDATKKVKGEVTGNPPPPKKTAFPEMTGGPIPQSSRRI